MAYNNIGQGTFTNTTGVNTTIVIPSGTDVLKVYNWTQFGAPATTNAIEYTWQRGMGTTGLYIASTNATFAVTSGRNAGGAFTIYDPSLPLLGTTIATTASTNAVQPVVSTGTTTGLAVGSVVRVSNTAQTDVNGIDMVVGAVNPGVSFTLLTATNLLATAPGAIGGAGFYRQVNYNPLFYPRNRYITQITQAANAQVSTSLPHNLTVGQQVRFDIPAVSGMIELNATQQNNFQSFTVLSLVDAYNFTVNADTTAFTVFTWPTIAQQPSAFPQVVPIGENTALALGVIPAQDILADATINTGFIGMTLAAGALLPAGIAGDVIYWEAFKSEFGGL
jgi:hypothetical protein